MLHKDAMLFHEVVDPWISLNFPSLGSPPGGLCSLLQGFSSASGVSLMLGQVASLLVTDEALVVPYVLHSVPRREIDLVNVHSIGIPGRLGGPHHLS